MNAISGNKAHAKADRASKSQKSESLAEVLKLISDDKSLLLFNAIFLTSGDSSDVLRTRLKFTRKQYYSRISSLMRAGLVKRMKRRYFVTAYGKVIYDAQRLLATAVKNHWKLKALDSLGIINDYNTPNEERKKIIDLIISNQQIKEILLSPNF